MYAVRSEGYVFKYYSNEISTQNGVKLSFAQCYQPMKDHKL